MSIATSDWLFGKLGRGVLGANLDCVRTLSCSGKTRCSFACYKVDFRNLPLVRACGQQQEVWSRRCCLGKFDGNVTKCVARA